MNNGADSALGLSAKRTAALLGISERHLWKLHSAGRVPRPFKLGRAVRWNRAELVTWLESGAPTRDEWDRRKAVRA